MGHKTDAERRAVGRARTPGKATGDIRWHGSQNGHVALADRQLKVKPPRRQKQEGEVRIPAYEALQKTGATGQRLMGLLLRGVSRPQYEEASPEMADTAGV
jgi:putative transposase